MIICDELKLERGRVETDIHDLERAAELESLLPNIGAAAAELAAAGRGAKEPAKRHLAEQRDADARVHNERCNHARHTSAPTELQELKWRRADLFALGQAEH